MSESFADTIKPKSDQLNADDLMVAPITVTITDVKRGPTDQPVHIFITGQQPYKPCKSMRRILIAAWGDKGADWIGKSLTLYCDPSVKFGGVALGGIRISHMSHIDGILNIMLTATRGRKAQFTVKPIVVTQKSNAEIAKTKFVIDDLANQWISAAKADASVLNQIEDQEFKQFIKEQVNK